MFIKDALSAIAGRPDLWIWRPTGELLMLTNRLAIIDHRNGRPRPYVAKLADLLTDDWVVGDVPALQKYAAAHWQKPEEAQPGE
jgi:hypothetical protein